ncbi:hypothetical protein FOA52_010423 [Chlamydomonas sp. UWO 241]|nr:hypothetical protein FOA52_010423 [Chlamydomonas sp. UWO 241]
MVANALKAQEDALQVAFRATEARSAANLNLTPSAARAMFSKPVWTDAQVADIWDERNRAAFIIQSTWRRMQGARAAEARRLYFEVPDNVRDFFGSTALELVRSCRSRTASRYMRADLKNKWHQVAMLAKDILGFLNDTTDAAPPPWKVHATVGGLLTDSRDRRLSDGPGPQPYDDGAGGQPPSDPGQQPPPVADAAEAPAPPPWHPAGSPARRAVAHGAQPVPTQPGGRGGATAVGFGAGKCRGLEFDPLHLDARNYDTVKQQAQQAQQQAQPGQQQAHLQTQAQQAQPGQQQMQQAQQQAQPGQQQAHLQTQAQQAQPGQQQMQQAQQQAQPGQQQAHLQTQAQQAQPGQQQMQLGQQQAQQGQQAQHQPQMQAQQQQAQAQTQAKAQQAQRLMSRNVSTRDWASPGTRLSNNGEDARHSPRVTSPAFSFKVRDGGRFSFKLRGGGRGSTGGGVVADDEAAAAGSGYTAMTVVARLLLACSEDGTGAGARAAAADVQAAGAGSSSRSSSGSGSCSKRAAGRRSTGSRCGRRTSSSRPLSPAGHNGADLLAALSPAGDHKAEADLRAALSASLRHPSAPSLLPHPAPAAVLLSLAGDRGGGDDDHQARQFGSAAAQLLFDEPERVLRAADALYDAQRQRLASGCGGYDAAGSAVATAGLRGRRATAPGVPHAPLSALQLRASMDAASGGVTSVTNTALAASAACTVDGCGCGEVGSGGEGADEQLRAHAHVYARAHAVSFQTALVELAARRSRASTNALRRCTSVRATSANGVCVAAPPTPPLAGWAAAPAGAAHASAGGAAQSLLSAVCATQSVLGGRLRQMGGPGWHAGVAPHVVAHLSVTLPLQSSPSKDRMQAWLAESADAPSPSHSPLADIAARQNSLPRCYSSDASPPAPALASFASPSSPAITAQPRSSASTPAHLMAASSRPSATPGTDATTTAAVGSAASSRPGTAATAATSRPCTPPDGGAFVAMFGAPTTPTSAAQHQQPPVLGGAQRLVVNTNGGGGQQQQQSQYCYSPSRMATRAVGAAGGSLVQTAQSPPQSPLHQHMQQQMAQMTQQSSGGPGSPAGCSSPQPQGGPVPVHGGGTGGAVYGRLADRAAALAREQERADAGAVRRAASASAAGPPPSPPRGRPVSFLGGPGVSLHPSGNSWLLRQGPDAADSPTGAQQPAVVGEWGGATGGSHDQQQQQQQLQRPPSAASSPPHDPAPPPASPTASQQRRSSASMTLQRRLSASLLPSLSSPRPSGSSDARPSTSNAPWNSSAVVPTTLGDALATPWHVAGPYAAQHHPATRRTSRADPSAAAAAAAAAVAAAQHAHAATGGASAGAAVEPGATLTAAAAAAWPAAARSSDPEAASGTAAAAVAASAGSATRSGLSSPLPTALSSLLAASGGSSVLRRGGGGSGGGGPPTKRERCVSAAASGRSGQAQAQAQVPFLMPFGARPRGAGGGGASR